MLDISKPLTAGKVQNYYRSEYSSASNSYFSQGGTLAGAWIGRLADELSLSGAVTAEAFDRLAEGQHPQTGEQLIQHRETIRTQTGEEVGHRAGWDLTFNAPKTVSLTALVGEDERVRDAHREAVQAALQETEKYVQARMGGNNAAETTGKWITAAFEHDTARPVDGYPAPHLHTHVVVFNLTADRNGQARSLQPYELFKVQSMSTAVYQNRLERELRRLGYEIERGTNHAPDIKGYSPEYLAAESLRSTRIARDLEEKGLAGREHRVQMAHQNRDEKLKLMPEELRALHKAHAKDFGDQPARIVADASHRLRQEPDSEKIEARASRAVAFARNRLSERNAVFEHFEVIRDALRHTQGQAGLDDIHRELALQKERGEFIEVEHVRPNAPAFRYTTPELVATLQAYLAKEPEEPCGRRRLFFVDETSLASGRQMRDFLQTIGPGDRVLLVGDSRQHQSVEAGRILSELRDAGMNGASLSGIVRQRDEGLRAVVEAMAAGQIERGVELLGAQNRICSVEHRHKRFEAIAAAYAAQPEGTLVVSPDNKSRQELNTAIRAQLRERGLLQPDKHTIAVLNPRQELTAEDRGNAGSYRIGDSVRYLRGSGILGIEPKTYATVIATDPERNRITIRKPDGSAITYDPARLRGVAVYEPEMRSFAVGDRVQFTAPWKARDISTRDLGTVSYLDERGHIRVDLDDSRRTIGWNLNENKHLDHAYAMTSHSSQGATVDRVLIHVDTSDSRVRPLVNDTLAYVAVSRPRFDAQIFTDSEENLTKALSRHNENSTALAPEQISAYALGI